MTEFGFFKVLFFLTEGVLFLMTKSCKNPKDLLNSSSNSWESFSSCLFSFVSSKRFFILSNNCFLSLFGLTNVAAFCFIFVWLFFMVERAVDLIRLVDKNAGFIDIVFLASDIFIMYYKKNTL